MNEKPLENVEKKNTQESKTAIHYEHEGNASEAEEKAKPLAIPKDVRVSVTFYCLCHTC